MENKHGIIIIIWFYIELVDLGLNSYEFLDFHLGFWGMRFQTPNTSVREWFSMTFMLIIEVLRF